MLNKLKTNYLEKVSMGIIKPKLGKKIKPNCVSRNSNPIQHEQRTMNTEMNLLSVQHIDNNLMDIQDLNGSIDNRSR